MAVKVLIVDDSGFFRRRLKELIDSSPDLEVVGVAANGREAIVKNQELRPDVITMDYEMPVMDGITAVRNIMASHPTPILMFSSLTYEGARITLDSLEAGAVDYLPKNFEEIANNSAALKKRLFASLLAVARSGRRFAAASPEKKQSVSQERVKAQYSKPLTSAQSTLTTPVSRPANDQAGQLRSSLRERHGADQARTSAKEVAGRRIIKKRTKPYKLLAIGTSTGGPVALQKVLSELPANYPLPIVLIQHMPASFTPAFAERLNSICKIQVREARDGDLIRAGTALLAPGGKQMMIGNRGSVRILQGDERLNYKPSVDVTFGSAANVFHDQVLAVVLTGMGADGRDGARLLKRSGSTVWAQDEASCVIYGMPMAVAKDGLADQIVPLDEIGSLLLDIV
jgi:two-component system chemotaxis response regulator CheB